LIKVFANLPDPQMRLLIVGDGDLRHEYEKKVEELGQFDKVIFAGTIPNDQLPCIYRAADVVTITSSNESFGIVAIEAMACGLPVIAHDIPGVGNVVSHNVDGLLTPLNDEVQLANNIRKILSDARLRQTMGGNGVEKVSLKYSWPSIVDKLENVYKELA
jgi:glycosyltransferase involved in cell wall biosynthesis